MESFHPRSKSPLHARHDRDSWLIHATVIYASRRWIAANKYPDGQQTPVSWIVVATTRLWLT